MSVPLVVPTTVGLPSTLPPVTVHAAKQLGKNVSSRRAAGRVRMRTTDQIRSVRARGRAVHASELSGVAQCGHHLGSEGAPRRSGLLEISAERRVGKECVV